MLIETSNYKGLNCPASDKVVLLRQCGGSTGYDRCKYFAGYNPITNNITCNYVMEQCSNCRSCLAYIAEYPPHQTVHVCNDEDPAKQIMAKEYRSRPVWCTGFIPKGDDC